VHAFGRVYVSVMVRKKKKIGQERKRERERNPWERVLIKFFPPVCVGM